MRGLFPEENNTGVLDKRAMLVLDVPGLPEASSPRVCSCNSVRTAGVVCARFGV